MSFISRRKALLLGSGISSLLLSTKKVFATQDGLFVPGGISTSKFAQLGTQKIQAFGDSTTSLAAYFPSNTDLTNVPQWVTSTVYPANFAIKNNGLMFFTSAGGTSAGVPGPTPTVPNDGGVLWVYNEFAAVKNWRCYLSWVELFSGGRLNWDMDTGYGGIINSVFRIYVLSGGSNYITPLITFSNNATGTVLTTNGVVTGVQIKSPGFTTGVVTGTITDAGGGTGATVYCAIQPSGTLAVTGDNTTNMLTRLVDAVSSNVDIMVVHGGTNDANGGTPLATTLANLKTIYEALMNAGKKVIAVPATPRNAFGAVGNAHLLSQSRWIRAYCRGDTWANPLGYRNIRLADPGEYWTDGTVNNQFNPIGGAGNVAGAMTLDGLHNSVRGSMYTGYTIWTAAQSFVNGAQTALSDSITAVDGYDAISNVGGNVLEGLPWQANRVYALGSICQNDTGPVKIYYVSAVAGNAMSAASGGPTGFGGSIVDNNVTWTYANNVGRSNFSGGTTGTKNAAAGIVYSGNLASNFTIARTAGSATGTVTLAINSPWTNGQIGTQQSIAWSLGTGTTNESWSLQFAGNISHSFFGITPADLGVTKLFMELDMTLSGIANCQGIYLQLIGDAFLGQAGTQAGQGPGYNIIGSAGEMITYPNGGNLLLRTHPMIIPTMNTKIQPIITFSFDASGGAGSATLNLLLNSLAIRRYGV